MKNLKKVLALVLVFASLFGLATMAGATKTEDYSDGDSISHIEAVEVMSTIGVFDGISGAFSGDSILTREQAAKIITYMILGKDEADALVASVAPYTDVARDRWSAGSIAYCKNEGILAGVGNGRFEPTGKLTGVAFAKMCLVALGYDPEIEILTGPQWAVNTSKLAIASAGITANLSQASLADEMSREDACQMALNTVKADLVDYDDRGMSVVVNNGDGNNVVVSSDASRAKPVDKETARVDELHNMEKIKKDKYLQFGERYFTKLTMDPDTTDSFGRPANTWTYKAEDIGTYIRNNELIQTWTAKAPVSEMYSAIGGSACKNLKDSKKDGELKVFVDGYYTGNDVDTYFVKSSSAAAGKGKEITGNIGASGNGVLTELYMDDSGNVTVAMINTYLVQATADYNTVTKRVNIEAMPINDNPTEGDPVSKSFLPTFISGEDFDVSGVKEGDYLLLNVSLPKDQNHKDAKSSVEIVTPATVQEATVTEYTDNTSVTMGGTKYSYNQILGDDEKGESFAINSEATLVLDTYGYIMCVAESMNSSNFVYIDNFGSTSSLNTNYIADAYFADGTNNEITVAKVNGYKIGSGVRTLNNYQAHVDGGRFNNGVQGQAYTHWYTFTGASGSQYTLNTPSDKRFGAPYTIITDTAAKEFDLIKGGNVRFMIEADGQGSVYSIAKDTSGSVATATKDGSFNLKNVRANEKTIFVIKNKDGDVSSYTGIANVPTVKLKQGDGAAKVSWICRKDNIEDNYASYVFVDVFNTDADVDDGNNVADYMFTLKATGNKTHVDGLEYFEYNVVIDGKEETRWINAVMFPGDVDYTKDNGVLFKNIKEDSRGRITSGKIVGMNKDGDKENTKTESMVELTKTESTIYQKGSSLCVVTKQGEGGLNHLTNTSYVIGEDSTWISDVYATSSNINLVIKGGKKGVEPFLYDKGASYEVHQNVSASYVDSMLRGYNLDGKAFLVVTKDNGDIVKTMWIYVEDARK